MGEDQSGMFDAELQLLSGPTHYNCRMPLIALQNVDYSVGGPLLLDHVDLSIEPNERIALIGRNGAGKSTLLKLLSGDLKPDDGEVRIEGGRRVARLEQEVPGDAVGTVFDVVAAGLGEAGALLAEFHPSRARRSGRCARAREGPGARGSGACLVARPEGRGDAHPPAGSMAMRSSRACRAA